MSAGPVGLAIDEALDLDPGLIQALDGLLELAKRVLSRACDHQRRAGVAADDRRVGNGKIRRDRNGTSDSAVSTSGSSLDRQLASCSSKGYAGCRPISASATRK